MNIFASLKSSRTSYEIALLLSPSFCDYNLLEKELDTYNFHFHDYIFIVDSGLNSQQQEKSLLTILKRKFGKTLITKSLCLKTLFDDKGLPKDYSCHRNLRIIIFTSDPLELDILEMKKVTDKLVGWTQICRKPTEKEIKTKKKKERRNLIIENLKNIRFFVTTGIVIGALTLICIYLNDHKEEFKYVAYVFFSVFYSLPFFIIYCLLPSSGISRWEKLYKTLGGGLLILIVLFLIFWLMPENCSGYIDDAHRPDKF